MTAIWINEKTGNVKRAADRKTAEQFGNAGATFESAEQLAGDGRISTKMLVDIYNELVGEGKTITKFSDRKTAASRVFALLVDKVAEVAPEPVVTPEAPTAPVAGKKAKGAGKPGAKGNRSKRIFPIDGKDPFKSGASAKTWELIKKDPGKTFADYVAMGGRVNTISYAIRNGWVRVEG